MRHVFAIALALLAVSAPFAFAQQAREPRQDRPAASLPVRPKAAANPCAEYGPGFVRVEGSSTCIRIGGGIGVGVGASR